MIKSLTSNISPHIRMASYASYFQSKQVLKVLHGPRELFIPVLSSTTQVWSEQVVSSAAWFGQAKENQTQVVRCNMMLPNAAYLNTRITAVLVPSSFSLTSGIYS